MKFTENAFELLCMMKCLVSSGFGAEPAPLGTKHQDSLTPSALILFFNRSVY